MLDIVLIAAGILNCKWFNGWLYFQATVSFLIIYALFSISAFDFDFRSIATTATGEREYWQRSENYEIMRILYVGADTLSFLGVLHAHVNFLQ